MIRLIGYLVLIALIAAGLGWLADRPGTLVVNWQGTDIETSVFAAVVMLIIAAAAAILVWTILKQIVMGRTILSRFAQRRRSKQGLEALSGGMIAIGAGDRAGATRYALAARRALPNEPLPKPLAATPPRVRFTLLPSILTNPPPSASRMPEWLSWVALTRN